MKKSYTITLDEEKVDELKLWLEKNGQTFSGYLNVLIEEQLAAIALVEPTGDISKVTIGKFLRMTNKLYKDLKKK